MRKFKTGATRSNEEGKLDYEGFLSPLVLKRYAEYLHEHRRQENGELRSSDNWQLGMPTSCYMKSAWRHFVAWWTLHRCAIQPQKQLEDAICAVIFNAMGYLYETLKDHEAEGQRPQARR